MKLSSFAFRSTPVTSPSPRDSFIFPASPVHSPHAADPENASNMSASFASVATTGTVTDLTMSTSTMGGSRPGSITPRGRTPTHPSALSLMMSRQPEGTKASILEASQILTPTPESNGSAMSESRIGHRSNSLPEVIEQATRAHAPDSESTPLLADVETGRQAYVGNGHIPTPISHQTPFKKGGFSASFRKWRYQTFSASPGELFRGVISDSAHAIPAVILGTLLNILDGVSCKSDPVHLVCVFTPQCPDGMIIFPVSGVFVGLGGVGVSMFFVSYVFERIPSWRSAQSSLQAILSQLVYSFGGSGFAGANGSMMIEVVVRVISVSC